MAPSAILNSKIYVANNDYKMPGSVIRHVRWSLLRSTNSPTANLYIKNFVLHYELVYQCRNILSRRMELHR